MTETVSVEVEVLAMQAVHGGTTLAHADVRLLVEGVEIIVRNLRVSRLATLMRRSKVSGPSSPSSKAS